MTYGFVFAPADVSIDLTNFAKLANNNCYIEKAYDEVSDGTKLAKDILFDGNNNFKMPRVKLVSVSLLTVMVGVARDVESRLHETPVWAGGVSLGELAAIVNAGSISLKQAAQLLLDREDEPRGELESVAFIFVPNPFDSTTLPRVSDVWLSVDYGEIAGGVGRMLMISGTRQGLTEFSNQVSLDVDILPSELCSSAYHSPLRERAKESVVKALNEFNVRAPRNLILSCISDIGVCTDVPSIISSISRSETEQLSVPKLVSEASNSTATDIFCIGPYLRSMELPFRQSTHYLDEMSQYDASSYRLGE